MAKPYIMPLGFIDRITGDETVFLLTNPEDSKTIGAGTPVTVWRYSHEHLALAKVRGLITAVGYTTATFTIGETNTDPRWPDDMGVLNPKAPVFLAQEIPSSRTPAGRSLPRKPKPSANWQPGMPSYRPRRTRAGGLFRSPEIRISELPAMNNPKTLDESAIRKRTYYCRRRQRGHVDSDHRRQKTGARR